MGQELDSLHSRTAAARFSLVTTDADDHLPPGALTSLAKELRAQAEQVLTAAAAADRTAGTSWDVIGSVLGIDGKTASRRLGHRLPD